MYHRILLKLSGEALGSKGKAIDPEVLERTAQEIKEVYDMGVQIGIVVGGGNLLRGKFAQEMKMDRCIADNIGMLGTMMNALSLKNALNNAGMKAVVMSAIEMNKIAEIPATMRFILSPHQINSVQIPVCCSFSLLSINHYKTSLREEIMSLGSMERCVFLEAALSPATAWIPTAAQAAL